MKITRKALDDTFPLTSKSVSAAIASSIIISTLRHMMAEPHDEDTAKNLIKHARASIELHPARGQYDQPISLVDARRYLVTAPITDSDSLKLISEETGLSVAEVKQENAQAVVDTNKEYDLAVKNYQKWYKQVTVPGNFVINDINNELLHKAVQQNVKSRIKRMMRFNADVAPEIKELKQWLTAHEVPASPKATTA